jgi:hypothetical protein
MLTDTTLTKPALSVGTHVVDRSGYRGVITLVTEWKGARWYDVRFDRGDAVRSDSDLTIDARVGA